jgi:hypothetical protein
MYRGGCPATASLWSRCRPLASTARGRPMCLPRRGGQRPGLPECALGSARARTRRRPRASGRTAAPQVWRCRGRRPARSGRCPGPPAARSGRASGAGTVPEVYGHQWSDIANCVANRRIALVVDARLSSSEAEYRYWDRNTFVFGPGLLPFRNIHSKALVVHEMTHAQQDWNCGRAHRTVRRIDIECAAYVAQALYYAVKNSDPLDGLGVQEYARFRSFVTPAWSIADSIAHGYVVSQFAVSELRAAILADRDYAAAIGSDPTPTMNGI